MQSETRKGALTTSLNRQDSSYITELLLRFDSDKRDGTPRELCWPVKTPWRASPEKTLQRHLENRGEN